MKNRSVLLLLMLFGARLAFGQNPATLVPVPVTKLEAFAARTDTLMATESYFLPGISGDNGCNIRLQAIILYEVDQEAHKVRGLKVEILEGQRNKDQRGVFSYVDFDELDGLSKAITTMLDLAQKGASLRDPVAKELSFSTVGGLRLAMVEGETQLHLLVTHALLPGSVCAVSRIATIIEFKTSIEKAMLSSP